MKKIFAFIISLCLPGGILPAQQPIYPALPDSLQVPLEETVREITYLDTIPYYTRLQGFRLGLDLGRSMAFALQEEGFSFAGSIDFEYRNHLYLMAEAGYTSYELLRSEPDLEYQYLSSGPFLKLGLDYNVLKPSNPYHKDMVSVGVRLSGSIFSQEVNDILLRDGYWQSVVTGSIPPRNDLSVWVEAVLGAKAEIVKNVFLGASLQGRFKLYSSDPKELMPQHIPGFGKGNKGFNIGASFSLFYTLPLGKKHYTYLKDLEP